VSPTPGLHADALAVLEGWTTPEPEQELLRRRYVDHLRARPDGMTRACYPDHVTAGVLVLSPDLDAVLLNLHRKARQWFAFGGHCEPGDATLLGAARRECLEESGLDDLEIDPTPVELSAHEVGFCDARGPVQHLDVRYAARAPRGSGPAVSEESLAVRWWPVDGLAEVVPSLQADMLTLVGRARERLQSTSPGGGSSRDAADQPSR
jgi:8-oxo-dGTP pyrophosphatase MutT (NUDIX family)